MKKFKIEGEDYTLKFSYRAAESGTCIGEYFALLSGAYLASDEDSAENAMQNFVEGTKKMVSAVPRTVKNAFHEGLLEDYHAKGIVGTREKSEELMHSYMEQEKLSYSDLNTMITECMEEDGFLKLSGLEQMLKDEEEKLTEITREIPAPQDHKKKQTGTN